jgi:hypothetical protein
MVKINIRDKNFGGEPSSCHEGVNKFVEWEFDNIKVSKSCFITDMCLPDITKAQGVERKIAWILEPRAIFPHVYNWIESNNRLFDYVLTFDTDLVNKGQNYLYYPHGRCWINHYIETKKTKNTSIVASVKNTTVGHQYRHRIIKELGGEIDIYGNGYKTVEFKEEALLPYRFSITIENSIQPGYWTEKIVDCFATKTIPIFWGDKSVCNYFNKDGIIFFNTIDDLKLILKEIDENGDELYSLKKDAIEENFIRAEDYRIPEDWIFKNYPFLFN